MDTCEVCGKDDMAGDLVVSDGEIGGAFVVSITETPDRNWILCDGCNVVVHKRCVKHPRSGYCDKCVASYGLTFDEEGCIIQW